MMVVTLLEPDLNQLRVAVQEFAHNAGAFEIRYDAFDVAPPPQEIRRLTRGPLIATCRRPEDGGQYRGAESERLALLERAHEIGFDYVDVEAGIQLPVPEDHLIRSVHDLKGTPPAAEIVARATTLARNGAVAKFAGLVRGFPDVLELLKATRQLHQAGLRAAVMGLGDYPRALGHLLGSHFVYGGGRTTAPHQPPLSEIRSTLSHWGDPRPQEDLYLVVGSPIRHSLSPRMHNAAFADQGISACYGALDVPNASDLGRLLEASPDLGLRGLSVTSPLKEAAFEVSHRRTPEAERANAANCLQVQHGRILAHNTDGIGATQVLERLAALAPDPQILLLGTGGAARGILAHAVDAHVTLAGRDPEKLQALAAEFDAPALPIEAARHEASRFDILVNATGSDDPMPLEGYTGRLFDLRYAAQPTPWERHAAAHALPFAGGRELLLRQGIPAFEWWTGRRAPAAAMARALGVAA